MTFDAFSDPGDVRCCQCRGRIAVASHYSADWSICCEMQARDGRFLCRECEANRRDELFFPPIEGGT